MKNIAKMASFNAKSGRAAINRRTRIALLAPQQNPNLPIPPRLRQHPRAADQGRVVPHMLVVSTCQLGNPMVFFVLEVAGYGLLHGVVVL